MTGSTLFPIVARPNGAPTRLPPGLVPRGLTLDQAAAYCGLDPEGFRGWQRRGLVPGPMPGTHRYDRRALDRALDRLSGLDDNREAGAPDAEPGSFAGAADVGAHALRDKKTKRRR